ncbi:MAG: hypothetical protein IKA17_11270 [Clostridia bacterium]|nr:hypothetical protein [Clostridia bacterium]
MKLNKFCLLFLCLLVLVGCENNNNEKENLREMYFGKNLTITISEGETVDAEYLQQMFDGKTKRDKPFFDLWDKQEFVKLIDYMDKNNLILVAGEYTFNQSWKFDNGFLVSNNNKKHEVFNFKQKSN